MLEVADKTETEAEVDQELLEEAQRQISAPSPNAAINEALRRLVETERATRRAALAAARQMVANGDFDFSAVERMDK